MKKFIPIVCCFIKSFLINNKTFFCNFSKKPKKFSHISVLALPIHSLYYYLVSYYLTVSVPLVDRKTLYLGLNYFFLRWEHFHQLERDTRYQIIKLNFDFSLRIYFYKFRISFNKLFLTTRK